MAIVATFQANFDQFVAAVKGAEASLTGIKTTAAGVSTAVAASLASMELRRFAGDVETFAKRFITAYSDQEAATSRLTTALRAQGNFTPELLQRYEDLATGFQKTTRFSDDAITSVQALLVQVGGVMPEQMDTALTAITNLAAGMGPQVGGLQGAALLVAKAFSSDGEALGKLKVILGDSIGPTASMEEIMAALNKKFGGQAAADIQTSAGKLEQFKNRSNEVEEAVGKLLITTLTPLADFFTSMPTWAQTGIVGFAVIGSAVAPLAISFAALAATLPPLIASIGGTAGLTAALSRLAPFLGPGAISAAGIVSWYQVFKNLDVFVWAAVESWKALTGTFTSAATAITNAAKVMYEGVKGWLVDRFMGIVDSIRGQVDAVIGFFRKMYDAVAGHSYVPDMMRVIAAEFALLASLMVPPAQSATQGVTQAFQGMADDVVRSGAVFRSEVVAMLNLEEQLQQTHQAAIAAQEAARAPRQFLQNQGGTSVIPTTLVTEANRAHLESRLATITASYAQYPGRMAGGSGRTGAMDARGWSNMLREQIEFQSLTNALRNSVPFNSGGSSSGVTIDTINVTQPLGTPDAIGRAISDHLTRAILQGRKVAV